MELTAHMDELERHVLIPATDAEPRNMGADLIQLGDGRLLLAYSRWLGGADDYDRSQICGMISKDGGAGWGPPFDVAVPGAGVEAVRMPCFLWLRNGQLACFARYRSSVTDTWLGVFTCQDETQLGAPCIGAQASRQLWSEPTRITPPAPGRHILLSNRAVRLQRGPAPGRILLPVSSPWPWDEADARGSDIRTWVLRSDDDGRTWQASDTMLCGPKRGLMEPYVTELTDGRLRLWMRTQMDCQYESISTDGGVAWAEATPGPLVSPESPVAVARHAATGLLMVVWNHNRMGRHTADRTPITVAFSTDDGASWFGQTDLDPAPGESTEDRSFSYPSAHFLGDRGFITYYESVDSQGAERRISLVLRRFLLRVE
jgi:sialidase-1